MQTLLCLALLCTAAVSRVEDIDAGFAVISILCSSHAESDELYETINGNTDHWYIMFYHANCVYCAELAPVFTRASTLVPSKYGGAAARSLLMAAAGSDSELWT